MSPVKVQTENCLLPKAPVFERTYGKDQPEYLPLPALITVDGTSDGDPVGKLVTMWQPNPGELALLQAGAPIAITLFSVNHAKPILPMRVEVGGVDLR